MEKDKEIAVRAREILSEPSSWTKGAEARTVGAEPVSADSPDAVAWSIYGAINKARSELVATGEDGRPAERTGIGIATNNKAFEVYGVSMAYLNNAPDTRFDTILDLLDEVISGY